VGHGRIKTGNDAPRIPRVCVLVRVLLSLKDFHGGYGSVSDADCRRHALTSVPEPGKDTNILPDSPKPQLVSVQHSILISRAVHAILDGEFRFQGFLHDRGPCTDEFRETLDRRIRA
jgi:hypothetical protein